MDYALLFGVLSGVTHLCSFFIYNRQVFKSQSTPNLSMWLLWVYLTILNFSSYINMTGDWTKSIQPMVGAGACLFTFGIIWYKGKFSRLDSIGYVTLYLGLLSGFMWWYFQSATCGNLLLQIPLGLSFIPTYRQVWRDPKSENPLAWYGWTLAYLFMLISVCFFSWKGQPQDLVYPLGAFLMHGAVSLLTYRKVAPRLELAQ